MTHVTMSTGSVVNFLYKVANFQSRAQLDVHVLHHHLRVEQQQSFSVDFLKFQIFVKLFLLRRF